MSDDVRLMLGDCVEMTRTLGDASIDLILTSPPYDNLRRYASGSAFDFEALALECKRVLVPGGVLVWVVGDQTIDGSETGTSFRQALHFMSIGLKLRDTMIWRKRTPFPGGDHESHYRGAFEHMFVFTCGRPRAVNLLREPCIQAGRVRDIPNKQHGRPNPRCVSTARLITNSTKVRENIWEYPTETIRHGHPAAFPLQLAIDHVLSWTDDGDTVCDPFMGSGTTGESCVRARRKFVGVEIDPTYMAIAEKRIAAARADVASRFAFA